VQVLVNLLSNAVRATRPVAEARTPRVDIIAERDGKRLRVALRDNGVGIEPEVLPRIFDPFFTTRDVGEGMGLGLSVCHTIVANHGGRLQARSEPGQWTEVSFDLPLG
jgi:two-component system sensor histidine kinase PhcS